MAGPEREEMVALLKAEMRAPLVALKALRASIDEGDLSPELASRMRRHTKSLARRLSLLLEDLVLVYTWGHRRLSLDLQDLDLGDQLRRAADLFPDMLIHVQAPPQVRVQADAMRLQQLLANLIHTAQRRGDRPVWLHVTCLESLVTLRDDRRPARGRLRARDRAPDRRGPRWPAPPPPLPGRRGRDPPPGPTPTDVGLRRCCA